MNSDPVTHLQLQQVQQTLQHTESRLRQAELRARQAEIAIQESRMQYQAVAHELQQVYQSRAWRVTRPLRWMNNQVRALREQGPGTRLRRAGQRLGKTLARQTLDWLRQHPQWQMRAIALSRKLGLHALIRKRLYHLLQQADPAQPSDNAHFFIPDSLSRLSQSGKQIHAALLAAANMPNDNMAQNRESRT